MSQVVVMLNPAEGGDAKEFEMSQIFRKSKMRRAGKAGYVLRNASISCDILILRKGKLVVVRKGYVLDNEDFRPSFSFQLDFQHDLAASIATPAFGKFSVAEGFALNVVGDCTSDLPEEERTDTDSLKFKLREALEMAENARREIQRETVRRKNAEAAAMESARKFKAIEDASKMKEENCQELARRLKEVEEELKEMVENGISVATQVTKVSHERHQALYELQALQEKVAAVVMQNCSILKQKEEEIKQLQDLLPCRSRLETPSSSSNVELHHSKHGGGGDGTVYKGQIRKASGENGP
ncbi:hypothetical protein SUGI_0446120 [Cryptomeria japonica]|nr:hypothetical protein SUGI_0446120 [Cryptomeria japonica]